MTGLPNRRYVDEELPELIVRCRDLGVPLTLGLADLDHFKRINDTHSHDVGDRVLTAVAALLRATVDVDTDGFVARLGGEEFLLVLPGVGPAEVTGRLESACTRIRAHPWASLTGTLPVTVSIGAVCAEPGPAFGQGDLLAAADSNLYAAKRGGRDRVVAGTLSQQSSNSETLDRMSRNRAGSIGGGHRGRGRP